MRNSQGMTFSHLNLPKEKTDPAALDAFDPMLSRNVQLGADVRTLYYSSDKDATGNSFLVMEALLQTAIMLGDKTTIMLSGGYPSPQDNYVLFHDLPYSTSVKAGRFVPSYGWRFADHNTFTRQYLGYGKGGGWDNGIEAAGAMGDWEGSFALTNGSGQNPDRDNGKAITVRVCTYQDLDPVNLTIGGSYRYQQAKFGHGAAAPAQLAAYGPFIGLAWEQWTLLGEMDWYDSPTLSGTNELVASHTLYYQGGQGWNLVLSHDFHMHDAGVWSADDERLRLGLDFYPTGYLELSPGISLSGKPGRKEVTSEFQAHVWF